MPSIIPARHLQPFSATVARVYSLTVQWSAGVGPNTGTLLDKPPEPTTIISNIL